MLARHLGESQKAAQSDQPPFDMRIQDPFPCVLLMDLKLPKWAGSSGMGTDAGGAAKTAACRDPDLVPAFRGT